jgi:hypothetical protein
MAVECRRLDKLEEAIVRCDNIQGALSYCINLSHQYVNHREYRFEVFSHFALLGVDLADNGLRPISNQSKKKTKMSPPPGTVQTNSVPVVSNSIWPNTQ